MNLPPGTLRVEGSSMCAHLSGMIMQPCFRVEKIEIAAFAGPSPASVLPIATSISTIRAQR